MLHNGNLYNSSLNTVRAVKLKWRWVGHVTFSKEIRSSYRTLIEKCHGKFSLKRLRRRVGNYNWVFAK
jgi:hypothetical protein